MLTMTLNMNQRNISLLSPAGVDPAYRVLSDEAFHDLAMDEVCKRVTKDDKEQKILWKVLTNVTKDDKVLQYRTDIFEDLYQSKALREELVTLLEKIDFLKNFGSFRKESDAKGLWDLMHRLDELKEYIACIEALQKALSGSAVHAAGLLELKEYIRGLYEDQGYRVLKKDIEALKVTTSDIQSVTLGVNLNERLEAKSIGLVSINNKAFTKSNVIANFYDFITKNQGIKDDTEWKDNYRYHPVSEDTLGGLAREIEKASAVIASSATPVYSAGMANVTAKDTSSDIMHYFDQTADNMVSSVTKKLRDVLSKHATISILELSELIPELVYYVRMVEYVEQLQAAGYKLCKPQVKSPDSRHEDGQDTSAKAVYNLKLTWKQEDQELGAKGVVTNDFDFHAERRLYILTGANRGGKTTITQAIGQLYVLAQGGCYVPAESFAYTPVDMIFTHFPMDEDKTLDLGRLGEECKRFKEIYDASTKDSLILLNETFSTTSFEEGYFIAYDGIRALGKKGVRMIYNTHMHKLGREAKSLNEAIGHPCVASMITETEEGIRSYRVKLAEPEGISYADDIAKKYGVTYAQLTGEEK